jgi:hypothetical protein
MWALPHLGLRTLLQVPSCVRYLFEAALQNGGSLGGHKPSNGVRRSDSFCFDTDCLPSPFTSMLKLQSCTIIRFHRYLFSLFSTVAPVSPSFIHCFHFYFLHIHMCFCFRFFIYKKSTMTPKLFFFLSFSLFVFTFHIFFLLFFVKYLIFVLFFIRLHSVFAYNRDACEHN